MIKKNARDCCGCTACAAICNKNAITMQPDVLGFKYPVVDVRKCVECGLCDKVCSFSDNYDTSEILNEIGAYAVRHKNKEEVFTSRSGGTFIAISDWILSSNGIVYGAAFASDFSVIHKRATTKEESRQFKGSKYVQSDLCNVFRSIKKDLKDGHLVLFSGTPCQISGLKSYIGQELRKNLFLVDIVCHGVPGPNIWSAYLSYIKKKYKGDITQVNFRDKSELGWTAHKESYIINGKKKYDDLYTFLFYEHIMFRKSCANCHFCNIMRPGDITLADFWDFNKNYPHLNADDLGYSLILCNTKKGEDVFEQIKKQVSYDPVNLKKCLQPNLVHPSKEHPLRDNFEIDFKNKGIRYVLIKYSKGSIYYYLKISKRNLMKKIAKLKKKILH